MTYLESLAVLRQSFRFEAQQKSSPQENCFGCVISKYCQMCIFLF